MGASKSLWNSCIFRPNSFSGQCLNTSWILTWNRFASGCVIIIICLRLPLQKPLEFYRIGSLQGEKHPLAKELPALSKGSCLKIPRARGAPWPSRCSLWPGRADGGPSEIIPWSRDTPGTMPKPCPGTPFVKPTAL